MAARFVVRHSPIHGRGVFATTRIPAGTRLIEYRGARIDNARAAALDADLTRAGQTYLLRVNDECLIDGQIGGNSARFINHGCAPNCEAVIYVNIDGIAERDKVWIETLRAIRPGEELTFDYDIRLAVKHTARLKRIWACHCGAPTCRGTMLTDDSR